MAMMMKAGIGVFPSVRGACAVGLIGFMNGAMIALLKLPPSSPRWA
jgi:ribose/xylose/arabinose/galactoside ABC-type transport system permease subunit